MKLPIPRGLNEGALANVDELTANVSQTACLKLPLGTIGPVAALVVLGFGESPTEGAPVNFSTP